MPLSRIDYETTEADAVEPGGVKSGAQALAGATDAGSGAAGFNPRAASATAASAAIAGLVKHINELDQCATRQIAVSREMTGDPSPQFARPQSDWFGSDGHEKGNDLPTNPVTEGEKAEARAWAKHDDLAAKPASKVENGGDDEPAAAVSQAGASAEVQPAAAATQDGGALEDQPVMGESLGLASSGPRQVMPSRKAPSEEPTENANDTEPPEAGRDFKNRFDAVRGLIGNHAEDGEELRELLEQAITLLESISQHPAIQDYSANQRKLEEIEQRLGYGAYPQ